MAELLLQVQEVRVSQENDCTRIVITGGPCAGKTTGLAAIVQFLRQAGYAVASVPEAATTLISSGIHPSLDWKSDIDFQVALLRAQHATETIFAAALSSQNARVGKVLICDRGLCDSIAYMGRLAFAQALELAHIHPAETQRYKGVIHLVTAALGAEEFYTTANNAARTETPERARELDRLTQQAWVPCQRHVTVPNRPGASFDSKINEAIGAVADILGIPVPIEDERKFLVAACDPATFPVPVQRVRIRQDYLRASEGERRVRQWGEGTGAAYFYAEKRELPGATGGEQRIQTERQISEREYLDLLQQVDPTSRPIIKIRHCFIFKDLYFELDVYESHPGVGPILEVELTREQRQVVLPPFLQVLRAVTGEPAFRNRELARQ
jgi:predicted ATPase/CYTH domain-containing protein